jgi:excisionase family DNA binding protein
MTKTPKPIVPDPAKVISENEAILAQLAVPIVEAGRLIGISRSAVYDLVASGELPLAKFGRRSVVLVSDLRRVLVAHTQRRGEA